MYVRILHRRSLQNAAIFGAFLGITLLLLGYPEAAATGIRRGLSICSSVIIPTLYPFMLLSGWLADSPLCRASGSRMAAVIGRLFGLPGCCGPAILLSLVGGYPAGALAIARLREQGLIDTAQAQRMTAFCIGGGPGFVIGTVGAGLLNSRVAGLLLYICQTVVSLAIGILLGRKHHHTAISTTSPVQPPRPVAQLVSDTCAALITMCGFVMLATTTLSLAEASGSVQWLGRAIHLPTMYPAAGLAALLEVSCGCIALAAFPNAPFWLSLCISWGGLSVQGQVAAALKGQRVLTPFFWKWRLLHGLTAGGLTLLLLRLFPIHLSTGAGTTVTILPFSVTASASIMLLLLSFLTMLVFSAKNTGNMG